MIARASLAVGLVAASLLVPASADAVSTSGSKPDVYCYTSDAYPTGARPKTCHLFLAGSDGFGMVLLHADWSSRRAGRADIGFIGSQGIYRIKKDRKFKFKRIRRGEAGVRYYTVIRAAGTNYLMFSS